MIVERMLTFGLAVSVSSCGTASSPASQSPDARRAHEDAAVDASSPPDGGLDDLCPPYQPVDVLGAPTARSRGACKRPGTTCTTTSGPTLCRGIGVGMGLAVEDCTCASGSWECLPRSLSKSSGCPLTPCEAGGLRSEMAPIVAKTGLLHCAGAEACDTNLSEICANGAQGQTIAWHCSCEGDGWSCTPYPMGDKACPAP